jgi:hypothetical protein
VPRWLAPVGRGPVRIAGTEVSAVSARATVLGSSSDWPPRPGAGLVWLADGAIRRSEGDAEALPEGRVLAPGDGSSSASAFLTSAEEQVQAAAWVERDALGGDRVRAGLGLRGIDWITPGALSTSVAASPAEPAAYASRSFMSQAWAAWTEATAAGGRVARAASFGPPLNDSDLGASGDAATTSTATAPSIYFLAGGFDAYLAWVEREGTGPARLRIASPRSPAWMDWGAPAEALVVDDATRPAVTAFGFTAPTVVWSSGGLLRLSSRDPDSGAWSPALVLNDDPAASASAPRLDAPAVGDVAPSIAWIERSARGDRILIRTRTAGTWELHPEAANADLAGQVAELALGADTVTWVDGTGRVFVRLLNP